MGLAYLDAKAPNLLVAYTLLTVATLPLDAVTLCMLGHPASFLQWARSTAYFFILIFKCASLVLMGMLHTKARPTLPIAHTTANSNSHAACTLKCHTHRRACMRRAAAAAARTTHPRNAPRHALQRAVAIQPRALFGADQVCAPATIGAARGVLRRRRPAHGKRRVQCVRWNLRSCLQTAWRASMAKSLQCTYHTLLAKVVIRE